MVSRNCVPSYITDKQEHHKGEQWFVVGDSIIRNVGTGQNNMMVECFLGINIQHIQCANSGKPFTIGTKIIKKKDSNDQKKTNQQGQTVFLEKS